MMVETELYIMGSLLMFGDNLVGRVLGFIVGNVLSLVAECSLLTKMVSISGIVWANDVKL